MLKEYYNVEKALINAGIEYDFTIGKRGKTNMLCKKPMLMESPLTKRVFIVTSYIDNGNGTFTARKKYDVTEVFEALAEQRRERERKN